VAKHLIETGQSEVFTDKFAYQPIKATRRTDQFTLNQSHREKEFALLVEDVIGNETSD